MTAEVKGCEVTEAQVLQARRSGRMQVNSDLYSLRLEFSRV